jgi:hypothetical protein
MQNDRFHLYVKAAYLVAVTLAMFTGIGNMPMWGRFYVADIPGLGWSGNFWVNIYVHYLCGAVLLATSTYFIIVYRQRGNRRWRLSPTGRLRGAILGVVLVSGVLSAIRNLPFINLPLAGLMTLVFVHLGSAMAYFGFCLACRMMKKPWMTK